MAEEEDEEKEEKLPDYLNTYPMTPDDLIGDACMRALTLRALAWWKERYGTTLFDEPGNPRHRPDAAETPPAE